MALAFVLWFEAGEMCAANLLTAVDSRRKMQKVLLENETL